MNYYIEGDVIQSVNLEASLVAIFKPGQRDGEYGWLMAEKRVGWRVSYSPIPTVVPGTVHECVCVSLS